MFTGIVQDLGEITFFSLKDDSLRMSIQTNLDSQNLLTGHSIACNGCCLTVVANEKKQNKNIFTVEAGPQTLALTNFKNMSPGSFLNLEPALKMGDSIGGHLVTGHIDALCSIVNFSLLNNEFWQLSLLIPSKYTRWIVAKGSIAIAGISLTIANIRKEEQRENSNEFSENRIIDIMIIPHTYRNTILQFYAKETSIEVEFDQNVKTIASIVESMLPNYIQA